MAVQKLATVDMQTTPRPTTAGRKLAIAGVVLLVVGAAAWIMQLTQGLLVTTGMNNVFVWGLMIGMFAFLVGFGAGAQLVCTVLVLVGRPDLMRWVPVAGAIGFACTASAAIAVLMDLGALRNILAMIFGLNLRSPLAWDMGALTIFLVLSLVQLIFIALRKDVRIIAALAGIAAVALQVVEGLLFSTQTAHAWWATPIMPIDFLMVAFVSGAALVLLVMTIGHAQVSVMEWTGRFLAIFILVHIVLALIDLGMVAAEGTPQSAAVMAALAQYWWLYTIELVLPFIAMIILFFFAGGDASGKKERIAAILTIIGIFAHRLMLLYPSYGAPSLYLELSGTDIVTGAYPISTGRFLDAGNAFATTTGYAPAPLEWASVLMPVGVAILAALAALAVMRKIAPKG